MSELDEIIADAKAEEEVKKEQFKKRMEEITASAKERMEKSLQEAKDKITISRDDYVSLKLVQADYTRVMDAIFRYADYNKYSESLGIKDDFMNVISFLYPEDYANKLEELKAEAE